MNAIPYINGDEHITDFPTCSARPLAIVVQSCNDLLGPGGYLSPENSVLALELAWQTVGTAGVADSVVHAWLAELLTKLLEELIERRARLRRDGILIVIILPHHRRLGRRRNLDAHGDETGLPGTRRPRH